MFLGRCRQRKLPGLPRHIGQVVPRDDGTRGLNDVSRHAVGRTTERLGSCLSQGNGLRTPAHLLQDRSVTQLSTSLAQTGCCRSRELLKISTCDFTRFLAKGFCCYGPFRSQGRIRLVAQQFHPPAPERLVLRMLAEDAFHQRCRFAIQRLCLVKAVDHAVQVGRPPQGQSRLEPKRRVARLLRELLVVETYGLIDHLDPQRLGLGVLCPAVIGDGDHKLLDHLSRHRRVLGGEIALLVGDVALLVGDVALLDGEIALVADQYVADGQCDKRCGQQGRDARHNQPMVAHPAAGGLHPRLTVRLDRFVRQPTFDVVCQFRSRLVPLGGLERHGLPADSVQGPRHLWPDAARRRKFSLTNGPQDVGSVSPEGSLTGEQYVERGSETVDISGRAEFLPAAFRLFGTHECRGPHRLADGRFFRTAAGQSWDQRGLLRRASVLLVPPARPGQSPIDHQRLAVLAEHNIAGLDVPMQHSPAVRILDGTTDVQKTAQQLVELERTLAGCAGRRPLVEAFDGRLQVFASDESHGVEGTAVAVVPQSIHGHDSRVL